MRIEISPSNTLHGTLILPLTQGDDVADASLTGVPSALKAQIANALSDGDFKGKKGEILALVGTGEGRALLVGLGKTKDLDRDVWRDTGAKVTAAMKPSHGKEFTVAAEDGDMHDLAAMAEGMMPRDYRYDVYITKDDEDDEDDSEVVVRFACEDDDTEPLAAIVKRMSGVVKGVHRSRDLGNCPPNDLYPMAYARQAMEFAETSDRLNVSVITYEEALERGMGGLVAVGMGSSRKPCMVIFELNAEQGGRAPVIVGKGITFDTGGLNLKPFEGMKEMKIDMGGAAAVIGAMAAIAAHNPDVTIIGTCCCTDNQPSPTATKPGDVLNIRNGKTVEVLNTDAEGRLVLADGLSIAAEENPDLIVDLATLTGACLVALGSQYAGLMGNNEDAIARVEAAATKAGERLWHLPLPNEYRKQLDSDVADLQNIGSGRFGGTLVAGLFLQEFVDETPWVHLDIAGPVTTEEQEAEFPRGATGFGVRTLLEIVNNW